MNTCKLCNQDVIDKLFSDEFGVCYTCLMELNANVKALEERIPEWLSEANSASEPDRKIMYLKIILESLYEYKINYYDKGIDVLTEDVDDMIDTIIEGIANARL